MEAKALHVTNLAECSRRYGANKGTKMVQGTVVEVEDIVKPASRRRSTFITADYDLGGGTIKRRKLNIRSVKAAAIPPATSPPGDPFATPTTGDPSTPTTGNYSCRRVDLSLVRAGRTLD